MTDPRAILLVQCPDRPGIIAAISSFLFRHGANITDFDQHTADDGAAVYFTRLEFQTGRLDLSIDDLERAFALDVARPFAMDWRLTRSTDRKRIAVLVSRHDHALLELLWTWRRGDLRAEIATVVSNHPDLRGAVEGFGVPFVHVPNTRETREAAEARMTEVLQGNADLPPGGAPGSEHGSAPQGAPNSERGSAAGTDLAPQGAPGADLAPQGAPSTERGSAASADLAAGADLLVLARYMQIVSGAFVSRWPNRIINIHHSFLPAFAGADPYRQAYERGVKVVGATAHYVTADLDAGPIIDQDVARVSHRDSVEDLKHLGRDLERRVLARAVRWHCEDRIIVHGNKTVVFA
jgi:formyltetrahydrofolate deformylase